jgi:hypothetical protein
MEIIVVYDDDQGGGIDLYHEPDVKTALKKIVEKLSYPTRCKTEASLLKHLNDANGDGCSFVFAIFVDGKLYYNGVEINEISYFKPIEL